MERWKDGKIDMKAFGKFPYFVLVRFCKLKFNAQRENPWKGSFVRSSKRSHRRTPFQFGASGKKQVEGGRT